MKINSNLRLRILSSLVLAPLALLAVYLGGPVYVAVIVLSMACALYEWMQLVCPVAKNARETKAILWLVFGAVYLAGSGFALIYLRMLPGIGMGLVYFLLAGVWGTDIGAYAAGKRIGGPKLAPIISPNKTWAGLFGGMALAVLFGYGVAAALGARQPQIGAFIALPLAVAAQGGDLLKSVLKRRAGVKDSGRLIPGHGGMLDRIDGLICAAILFALFEAAASPQIMWF